MLIRKIRKKISFMLREVRNSLYRFMGVDIGKNVFISSGAWIDTQEGKVVIEDNVRITNGCKILSHDYSVRRMGRDTVVTQTTIKKNVFIGMNVVVLPGVTIGQGSIVGAGCVISEDVPPFSLIVGAKPRIVKQKQIDSGNWVRLSKNKSQV